MAKATGEGILRTTSLTIFAFALAFAPVVGAAQLEVIGGQSIRHSDNARKAATNESSDQESRTYVTATYVSGPGRCNASFGGTVGYSTWLDDAYGSETDANLDLESQCELASGLFWNLNNNLREVSQDTTQTQTPENRTRKNLFSTGPRYILRLGSANSIAFDTKYENTEFSEPDEIDSERYIGSIAWTRLITQTLSGGISAIASRTELDSGADIDVETVKATFNKAWPTTVISGAFGVSEIETNFGSNSETNDGIVGELELTRAINPSTNWYLKAARELTDRTSSFDLRFDEFEFNLNESISVETTALSTGIDKVFSDRSSLNARLFVNRTDLLETDELEESAGLDLLYSRPLSELLGAYTGIGYRYSKYEQDDSDDERTNLELGLDYLMSRELKVYGQVGHEQKDSDVPSREFRETWVQLGIEYRFR